MSRSIQSGNVLKCAGKISPVHVGSPEGIGGPKEGRTTHRRHTNRLRRRFDIGETSVPGSVGTVY